MPLATIAANRQTEPTKLSKEVRGELDWIVMKALEKDRDRRYETAAALAADLTHYLADEPVTAAAPSQLYRIHKFIRRNRVPVIAATLVAVAILAGVAASTLQAVRATRAERAALASAKLAQESAEREASQRKKAEDIVSFLISAYQVDNPEPDSQSVAEVLKHSAQKLQDAYPDNPGARAVVLSNIGRSYVRLRRFEDAEQIYRKCLALAKDPGLINIVHQEFANCLLRLGKYDEAVEILQPVVLEKANHSGAPDAIELREAWPGLPDTQATPRGKPGMDGLDFDGERDYVILSRMFFDGRPPWTLEAIVRPIAIEQAVPDGWTSLVSAANGGSISLDTNQRRWAIELHTALISSDDWTKNYSTATSRTEVVLGEWQHVAGVWDGHELRLYLNGQLQETRTGVEFCADLSLAPMFLGADPSASYIDMAQGYLLGRMRAVRISRVAKYTDSFPRPERLDNTPGTIGLYDFTIDTGRYAFDQSGHGNHGIIIGATFAKASE
jgi:predicted negative regulator of RcsB-dependent stress response